MGADVTPPRALFVGGTGRSGSNVLKAMLARATDVTALPFETRILTDPDGVLPAARALSHLPTPFEADRILARLEGFLTRVATRSPADRLSIGAETLLGRVAKGPRNLRPYKEWELEEHIPGFGALAERLICELGAHRYDAIWPGRAGSSGLVAHRLPPCGPGRDRAFDRFFDDLISATLRPTGARLLVDDNTFVPLYASELASLCPAAHIVHIVRDPRDVVTSLLAQRWAPSDPEVAAAFYAQTMAAIWASLQRTPSDRQTMLRLEDLVSDPRATLAELADTAEISLTADVCKIDAKRANLGRWKEELPESIATGQVLAPYIARFGYDG